MACKFDTNRKGFSFTWILEKFEYCSQQTGENMRSPAFIVETMERTKWCLFIYPRGVLSDQWISLYLIRVEDSKGSAIFEADYELSFLASDGSALKTLSVHKHAFQKNQGFGFRDFEERESVIADQSKFLTEGALTIQCRIWRSNVEAKEDGQCIARTRIGVERKAFLWTIQDFITFDVGPETTLRLKSTSDDKPIVNLNLFLRENGSSQTIVIRFDKLNQSSVFSTFKSSLFDAKGRLVNCDKHAFLLSSTAVSKECSLSLSKDTLMENSSYLPYDILVLNCECAFSTGVFFSEIESTNYGCSNFLMENSVIPEIINTSTDLKTDLCSMLQDKTLCDVMICRESETFPAHWIILSARSPVFRAMFESDMEEKARGRINIEDLKADTVRRMLVYMYTDYLEELLWETASELYAAAEKYQILSLKVKCSSFLMTNLRLTNACEILLFADLHQDKELKTTVQNFILENDKSIINSSEWQLLMRDNVNLAAETMFLKFKE